MKVPALALWSKLPEAKVMPVAPVIAPVLLMSMLVVFKLKVPAPPPMLTRALEVPVPMLVALLALALMLVVPVMLAVPVRVKPPVPWSKPVPELMPTPTMAPAELTVKLPKAMELLVLPLIVVEAPARPRVRAFWVVVPTLSPVAVWVSKLGLKMEVSAYRVRQELAAVPRSIVLSALGLSAWLIATVPDRLDSCWLAQVGQVPAPPATPPTTLQRLSGRAVSCRPKNRTVNWKEISAAGTGNPHISRRPDSRVSR